MICFHFSIFEPLETAITRRGNYSAKLWFAFILVSLNHWKQLQNKEHSSRYVVICFHFSIFEPLETATCNELRGVKKLWFAFILVSLNHWKQPSKEDATEQHVVICFHFSIFEPLETAVIDIFKKTVMLWFAFILVSLNHWKQRKLLFCATSCCCDLLSF